MEALEQLLELPGVFAAGRFDDSGELHAFRTIDGFELPEDSARQIAEAAFKADAHMREFGASLQTATATPWTPPLGWVYAGGEYSVAISNGLGVFASTFDVDFNNLFSVMVGAH